MYLSARAIDETFQNISQLAGAGSIIVFDTVYKSILTQNCNLYGEEIKGKVDQNEESFQFGLNCEEVGPFS